MTIQQAFALALQRHQAGQLADAEALYRQILAVQPSHADALHFLGVIAHQAGRHDVAVDLIRQAIVLNPDNPSAQANLGAALTALGQLDEAMAAYRRALELQPEFPNVHINLGVMLAAQGRRDEAIAAYRRALELQPDSPEALNNLGNALKERGELDEALAACRRALELRPDYPEAHNNLGNALAGQGHDEEALAAYRRAVELKPDYAEAHYNLGSTLAGQGRFDEATAAYRRALELKPDYAEACYNLGNALSERGQLDEAIATYRRAIELKPGCAGAQNNLGSALAGQGRLDEAIATYRQALRLKPDLLGLHGNLGIALRERGQLDEAVAAFRQALQLRPDLPEAHSNLGNALKDQGDLDGAIAAYRRSLDLKPDHASAQSNLIHALHFHPGHDAGTIAAECRRWNRQFGEPLKQFILPHPNDRDPERPLRIGYVSPDLRDHVVGRNLLPLFEHHDPRNFEILCYAGVVHPDRLTAAFRQRAQQWRSTVGLSDEALAEIIRRDRVDILVDLTQHMARNRLPMFARKPAPVQVSFAGYPESTGLEAIEYRISDRSLETPSETGRPANKEQVSLLDSFWCYDVRGAEPEVNSLPALESGIVTFGCLNNFCKVNEPLLRLWARVLKEVPDSRLILLSSQGSHRQRTLETLAGEGVEPCRVEFAEFRPRPEYLELYHRLDIALDTFPYNGHTTSLDALWMGVPVVSLVGLTPVSRAGLSQLTNLGLPDLAAHSEPEFVAIAARLAGDLPHLAQLRSTLRARMKTSVLMDAPRFARSIEAAYRSMWRSWCKTKDEV
jgi:protein O-GlcNAc transferase